ncbi:Zinc finger C2H2 [Penicillium chermesinum]|uniref:Zinc finger C2H2 n=1 Tax=Penicillium chermesinum TaxID=63820 RepID=A0A9W9PKL8_9EURO|nr:Zinc finger C2H2 [Penicillium chermesinum]KAJ5247438.1 Zinc finger C2H2 [Penicillium chermesinum]
MLMYTRKDLITDPYNPEDIIIQDDQFPPEFAENSQHSPLRPLPLLPHPPFPRQPSPTPTHPPRWTISSYGAPSMTPASSYNPSMDVQSSASPSSQYLGQYPQYYTPMLTQQPVAPNQAWDNNLQLLSPARIPFPSKASPSGSSHRRSDSSNKPLPTPVQTPVQNSFLAAPFQNYDPSQDASSVEAESAMRRAIMDQTKQSPQQQQQNEHSHSLAPSVSTLSHNSPVTPQTSLDEIDDLSKMTNGETQRFNPTWWMDEYLPSDVSSEYANGNGNGMGIGVPKLDRTISDIYQDELFNPTVMAAPQMSKPMSQNLMVPRNMMADRIQAASQGHLSARSQSPVSGLKRERSPFRQSSEYANFHPHMATSVPMAQNGMNAASSNQSDLKTMSPKDASDFNLGDVLGLRRDSGTMRQAQPMATMDTFPSHYAPVSQAPYGLAQQLQRSQQSYLQQPDVLSGMPSNEVRASVEVSPRLQAETPTLSRPRNTSSDTGTYTCTYHGCTHRFESPSKLQRHKREAHRQTSPGGHLVARDTSMRNSQAGPHRCERINPSTGKPCNSIFSRPYDLTRHEDTIHNARKQKVRCHLCTEEKTFSRNDALTRHMRVVHPEVDWPGKQRRRGRD